jgi:DNA-binding HxlR family transcriptional regulator
MGEPGGMKVEGEEIEGGLPYTVESGLEKWGGLKGLAGMRLDPPVLERLEKIYSLLSAHARIEILYYLNFTSMTPGVLSRLTEMTPNLISFHLKKLEKVGVITHVREGKYLIYTITDLGKTLLGPLTV